MNEDLKLRLTAYQNWTPEIHDFFKWLCHNLGWFAMKPCKEDANILIYLEYIENDEDDSAYMLGDDDHQFEIYLDKRMPFGMIIDFLLHEMAHIRSWHHDEADDHGPEFGRAYAALYRKYLKLYDMWWG
ncbi:MAG: hypothetical protein ACYTFQ_21260 [Planctomycetota bacterium]